MMKHIAPFILALLVAVSSASFALADDAHHASAPSTVAAAGMTDGEIKKVDKDAGKLTIKHGPIPNLEMPNMTMVFRAGDPAILEQVKAGDKVKFAADRVNGLITVTTIEAVK